MTENPKVVVLGPPGVGKKALALALQSRSNTVTVSSIGGAPAASSGVFPLALDTKYYTANLDVLVRSSSAFYEVTEGVLDGAEALIFVMNACSEPSCIEALHRWSSALSSAPSTLLIVLSHSDCSESVPTAAEFRERCFEWSLDHGFEVIDANCTAPEEGDDPRDKTGIPRVMEALESTMWSSMTMKPRGGSQFSSVVSASSRPAALPMTPIIVEEKAHKPEAVDVAEPLSGEDVARITSDRILDDVPEVSDRLEGMLDNLESLMQQIQGVRSAAGGKSDADRREDAATLAMRLAMLMGLGDVDGSGSDGEDD